MDELHRDMQALHPKSQDMDWLFYSNNPLSPEIAIVGLHYDFNVLKDMFEGRKDPQAHLMQYNDYMNVLRAFDATKCNVFSTTLKASANDWYLSLLQGSICNFSQLGKMFLGRFRAH